MLNLEERISAKMSMFDFLCKQTDGHDFSEAFEYFGKKYTFGELKAHTRRVASALRNHGVKKGDKIVMSLITTPESIFLLYACGIVGAVPVLADVRYSKNELSNLCDNISPKLMFLSDWQGGMVRHLQALHPQVVFVIVSPCAGMNGAVDFFRSFYRLFTGNVFFKHNESCIRWKNFIQKSDDFAFPKTGAAYEDSDIIFTTSGTTGKRKYVVMSHEKLNLSAWSSLGCGDDYSAVASVLSVMPLFTLYGWVISIHLPLCMGKKLILCPVYDNSKIPSLLLKKKPNAFSGVPHHFEIILNSKKLKEADLSFLKHLTSAGDSFGAKNQAQLNQFLRERNSDAILFQAYGMTESGGGACRQRRTFYADGSVGKPLPGVRIKIVDEIDGITEVSAGMCGEVCINTPYQTAGYYHDEEATAALIHHHADGKDWIYTGDLGHMDLAGNMFIDGRKKRMIVADNGTKVFLQLVEDEVKTLPGITDCALTSYIEEGTKYVRRLALFIVPDKNSSHEKLKQDILAVCKNNLPEYLSPNDMVFCDSIPRTSSGKHDIAFLEKEALRRSKKP